MNRGDYFFGVKKYNFKKNYETVLVISLKQYGIVWLMGYPAHEVYHGAGE